MNAIARFNDAFDFNLDPLATYPAWEQDKLIEYANNKGRRDLANSLRDHFDAERVARIRERERK